MYSSLDEFTKAVGAKEVDRLFTEYFMTLVASKNILSRLEDSIDSLKTVDEVRGILEADVDVFDSEVESETE